MAPKASIRHALQAVTASLIGASATQAAGPNTTETSILIYKENDRTRATEATFNLNKALKNNFGLNLRLTFDALTGATPTGASPSKYAQTFTRPSGGQVVLVPAGEYPVDEKFNDTRFSADAALSRPLLRYSVGTLGLRWSGEADYKSLGIHGGYSQDFNRRNTTIGVRAAYNSDKVRPVGGFYAPFSEVGSLGAETPDERRARFQPQAKKVFDAVLSLAQVVDRTTVVRVNWSVSRATGYLTDPYKIISVVQSPDSTDPGEPVTELYENRPGKRSQNAVMTELRKQLWGLPTSISYRYFWDNWDVRSHSVYLSTHLDFKRKGAIMPHVRWYLQSAANFHAPFLVEDNAVPAFASADSRLAKFTALTFGLGYSVPVKTSSRVTFSMEYYLQRGDVSPPADLSSNIPFELFPKLDVIMVRMGYAHEFF